MPTALLNDGQALANRENENHESVVVSVIVPTYREGGNLPVLVPRVGAALRQANVTFEILSPGSGRPG